MNTIYSMRSWRGYYILIKNSNETVISCVVAEIKSDVHTMENNIVTAHNGCVSEFLVDQEVMNETVRKNGDMSSCEDTWDSPVIKIKVYKKSL